MSKNILAQHKPSIDWATSDAQATNIFNRLSLEGDISFDVVSLVQNVIPTMTSKLNEAIDSITTTLGNTSVLPKVITTDSNEDEINLDTFKHLLSEYTLKEPAYNYTFLSEVVVSIPEGFSGSMISYMDFVLKASSTTTGLSRVTLSLLKDYHAFLAQFVTNKDMRAHSSDALPIYKQAQDIYKHHQKEFNSYFPINNGKSKSRLGYIFERLADVKESFSLSKQLFQTYNEAPMVAIKEQADKCAQLLNTITMSDNKQYVDNVSKASAKKIADGAYILAQLLEITAVYRIQHQTLIKVSVSMQKDLIKAMK